LLVTLMPSVAADYQRFRLGDAA